MKFLLTIPLSLLVLACDNPIISFKKSCNTETAKQTVAELAEVKAKIQQIEIAPIGCKIACNKIVKRITAIS